jgi:hypothetical protein
MYRNAQTFLKFKRIMNFSNIYEQGQFMKTKLKGPAGLFRL